MNAEDRSPPGAMDELEFSRHVESVRPALRGYTMSLLPDRGAAEEVFQDTLLYLWRNREKFEPGTSFRAWAFRCGYFCALAKKRDRSREKTVFYPDEFLHRIAEHAERHADAAEARSHALRECLGGLPADERARVVRRYAGSGNRASFDCEPSEANRLYKAFSRLRLRLKLCVEKRLKAPV